MATSTVCGKYGTGAVFDLGGQDDDGEKRKRDGADHGTAIICKSTA